MVRPDDRRQERHLQIQPEPDVGPVGLRGEETLGQRSVAPTSTAAQSFAFTEAVVRAGWSMRLHALLGEEVARAVAADILTLAEAEVLLARLAVVIDQAVGAGEN
jgi:hypothetical protein